MIMDISSAAISFNILSPEIIVLGTAMLILMLGNFVRGKVSIAFLALIGLVAGLFLSLNQWNQPQSGYFGMVIVDNFSVYFDLIFIAAAIITILMAHRYMIVHGIDRYEFYAMLLFSVVGMMTMTSSTDLVVIFLGLEIMSVPLYVMAGFARNDLKSNESSIKYFMMGAFATGFLLYGIALIYGAAETTDLRRIMTDFAYISSRSGMLLYSGAFLVLVGFGFKIAAVPFHMWVPDVYEGAPTPVTAFFSVAPKAAGFAALLRIFICGMPALNDFTPIFWILAVLTMTGGNLMALMQKNIKRMLACSSIAHAGYVLVALTAGGEGAVSAAVFYLLAYTFFNLGGFAVVTMLDSRSGSEAQISEMKGLAARYPYLAALLALFMFALVGLPPTAGFFGKFFILSEAVKQGQITLVIIAVLNSFVSVYYYLRVVWAAYFEKSEGDKEFKPVVFNPALVLLFIITVAGTLILGLFPQYWLQLARLATYPFI